jgi:biopolymer transport protein TolR
MVEGDDPMSMNMGNGGGDGTLAEINVTPMVDVMLVLLIIFMVTAPLMQQGVEVQLPQTTAAPIERTDEDNLILSLTKDKKIFLSRKGSDVEIAYDELVEKLKFNEKLKKDKELFLRADKTLDYGYVVDILAKIKDAEVTQLGMLTEPESVEK